VHKVPSVSQALGVLFSSVPPGLRRPDHPGMGRRNDGQTQREDDRVVSMHAIDSLSALGMMSSYPCNQDERKTGIQDAEIPQIGFPVLVAQKTTIDRAASPIMIMNRS
jgi:hypothetical protein